MRATRIFAISILTVGLAMVPAQGGSGKPDKPGERSLTETLDDTLRGLIEQLKPTFEDLAETFKVLEEIDSIEYYESPEILPNGDVLMRRREDAPPLLRDDEGEADEDQPAPPSVKI